jgi:exodeoxyribonuclease VII large subunit
MKAEPTRVYSVSDITFLVKDTLEREIPPVWVVGEISNFIHHRSGHMYFSLKDDMSQLKSVMFRSSNSMLSFVPMDGMKVVALGMVTVYEAGGVYQLQVKQMQPLGVGELQKAFEKLKKRLSEEGLFDEANKKKIPLFPDTIGVVTSPSGAAIRDILRVLARRMPSISVVVRPVRVQGPQAAQEIAEAIRELDRSGLADVMIIGRGGGSIEDLWPFNEEIVARAIFQSKTPVISAVGHEVDYTISDFVADLRAPTPSAAAELASPSKDELSSRISMMAQALIRELRRLYRIRTEDFSALIRSYGFRRSEETVKQLSQRRDDLERRLMLSYQSFHRTLKSRLERSTVCLAAHDPKGLLARGYAFVEAIPEMRPVRSVDDLSPGAKIRMTLSDGKCDATIDDVSKELGRGSDG